MLSLIFMTSVVDNLLFHTETIDAKRMETLLSERMKILGINNNSQQAIITLLCE
jgi:hypothetical protein